ncbi:IS5 family transposase [Hymenobacter perfusus]|uniref:IS5 family transposase n=1 Tax=Hymenobacter perfusus TaxID=1236770 RepID=A0A428JW79_9BACT|nr:IS5 family transposase [Hymenobacter perfusus]RSK38459.1 IS5 family transposase [Hymenobacter perfusus]
MPTAALWAAVEPLLPAAHRLGRPRVCDRQMFFAIFYVLRAGLQWKALPRCLGVASTAHDRFQRWVAAGVFRQLWVLGLLELHIESRLDWSFQSLDGCQTKAPLGGQAVGPNPTDRGKGGVKRHLLTEAQGLPVGLAVTGANVADVIQVQAVFDSMPVLPSPDTDEFPQGFCADKGHDAKAVRHLIQQRGYVDHIQSRDQEATLCKTPGYRARRWVVERTHSWFNRFRRLLIRWEKQVDNYEALLHLACANIVWKQSLLFG